MIISNDFNNYRYNSTEKKQQSFQGAGSVAFNALDKFFSILDKNAMIQVSFVDTVSTNIPRTIVDLQTSLAASLETFRREFSGLFVNCLMPGGIVWGIAKLMPKKRELKETDVASSWANGDTIDKLKEVYKKAHKKDAGNVTKEYVKMALTSIRGLEGTNWIEYSSKAKDGKFLSAVEDVTNAISKQESERKKLIESAHKKLSSLYRAESILEFNKKPHSNLEETLRDIVDLGGKFNKIKQQTEKALKKSEKELTNIELSKSIDKYSNSLKNFVNKKSGIGLLIVMLIAVSMQTINRAITRKQFNTEGAPIYKDFGKKETAPKMNEQQKKEFFGKKVISALSMYALAALSMMKKPSIEMFQFKGKFPTLDQCRWIAAATFASRMLAAEDENELRETTIRDLASFCVLYFLGDYVKKGVASFIEMLSNTNIGKNIIGEKVVLLNRKKVIENSDIKDGKFDILKNVKYKILEFCNWIKNTDLKTSFEVSNTKVRNLRNLCRAADISFSLVTLGILLPKYNRKVTEQKVLEAKKQVEKQKKSNWNFYLVEKQNTPLIFRNISIYCPSKNSR